MKIAQLVSNYHATSPFVNQAIYSSAAWLTNSLVARGNDVTLYAAGDSKTNAELRFVTPTATSLMELSEDQKKYYAHLLVSACYGEAERFDVIHSHFALVSSFYSQLKNTPTVQSIHSPIDESIRPYLNHFKDNNYISFSRAQQKQMPQLNWIGTVYHGVNMQTFQFNPAPQNYLLYLGRITSEKGVHLAIEAAKAAGVQLLIAGASYPEEGYWSSMIEPHIDGKTVRYVGSADFTTKIEYLKNAKALLFPTQYDEAFGLAMIEALACGTPVIGWKNGSVPEVVADKTTGYVVKTVAGMKKAIDNIDKISRQACRDRAIKLFSVEKMVEGYERVYLKAIETQRKKQTKK